MSKRKTIAVAIVLALVLLIGGMLAFFTDTDTATNVFTLGNVDISLSEPDWEEDNATDLLPGATIVKNPVVTNESSSNNAYVFVEVIVPCYASGDTTGTALVDEPLFTLGTTNTAWNLMSTSDIDTTAKTITYVYNYGDTSGMTSLAKSVSTPKTATPEVFHNVTLASNITGKENGVKEVLTGNINIVVNAYGIQTSDLGAETPLQIYGLFAN